MKEITKKQIAMIQTLAKKELKLNDEELYGIVYQISGGSSISALTAQQGIDVIDTLLSYKNGKKTQAAYGTTTEKQVKYIKFLLRALGWQEDEERFKSLVKNVAKVDSRRFLTDALSVKIIEALKALADRKQK